MMQTFNTKNVRDRDTIPFDLKIPHEPSEENPSTSTVETFHLNGHMPAWLIIEVDAAQGRGESSRKYLQFFRQAIIKEEQARWLAVVRNPENGVDNEVLSNIYNWIYEVYANLPTQEAESSSTGQDEQMTLTDG